MSERRHDARITGPFEGHWHGGSGANEVRISDMSLGGCFVETMMQPVVGEETDVTVLFADLKASMELLANRDPEEARAAARPRP